MRAQRRPIDPTPQSVGTMLKWCDFMAGVFEWSVERVKLQLDEMIAAQADAYAPRAKAMQKQVEATAEDELHITLVLLSLQDGSIDAYVSFPPTDNCYRLEPYVWHTFLDLADAFRSIEEGQAPERLDGFSLRTLERDLAKRPLFIPKKTAQAFMRERPPSVKQLIEAARAIVSGHEEQYGDVPLTKAAFVAELRLSCPTCSKNRAEEVWAKETPPDWRKPGRRKTQHI